MRHNLNTLKNKNFKRNISTITAFGAVLLGGCGPSEMQPVKYLAQEEIMDCREYTRVEATFKGDEAYDPTNDPVYLLSRADEKKISGKLGREVGLGDIACYREVGLTGEHPAETDVYLTGIGLKLSALVLDQDS